MVEEIFVKPLSIEEENMALEEIANNANKDRLFIDNNFKCITKDLPNNVDSQFTVSPDKDVLGFTYLPANSPKLSGLIGLYQDPENVYIVEYIEDIYTFTYPTIDLVGFRGKLLQTKVSYEEAFNIIKAKN